MKPELPAPLSGAEFDIESELAALASPIGPDTPVPQAMQSALSIPDAGAEDASSEEGVTPEEAQAEAVIQQDGLDFAALSAEYASLGGLSEESYAALDAAGIPPEFVDSYLEGVESRAEQIRADIFGVIGGQEKYEALARRAAATLPKEEIALFNSVLQSSTDIDFVKMAIIGLAAKVEKIAGKKPSLVKGEGASGSEGGYSTIAQHVADVNDPRYKKDAAFRKMVEDKLRHSRIY